MGEAVRVEGEAMDHLEQSPIEWENHHSVEQSSGWKRQNTEATHQYRGPAIASDRTGRHFRALDDREHRDADSSVVLTQQQGEGPEMGWRPNHHQSKQPPAPKSDMPRCRRRTNQRRYGTGHTADDDVLRRSGLEKRGVQQHVGAKAQQRQPCRQTVHAADQQHCRRKRAGDRSNKGAC